MSNYEIWGPDSEGDIDLLGHGAGPVPKSGDTIEVAGKDRAVKRVGDHHGPAGTTKRVYVGPEDEGDPLPVIIG